VAEDENNGKYYVVVEVVQVLKDEDSSYRENKQQLMSSQRCMKLSK